jgi:putative sterol carrier protein
MTLQEITAKMKSGAGSKSAFGNTVKFSTPDGAIYIDGKQSPPSVSNDDNAADCTIKMSLEDLVDMVGGKLDGMTAFMTGKLKIEGDMGVAMTKPFCAKRNGGGRQRVLTRDSPLVQVLALFRPTLLGSVIMPPRLGRLPAGTPAPLRRGRRRETASRIRLA